MTDKNENLVTDEEYLSKYKEILKGSKNQDEVNNLFKDFFQKNSPNSFKNLMAFQTPNGGDYYYDEKDKKLIFYSQFPLNPEEINRLNEIEELSNIVEHKMITSKFLKHYCTNTIDNLYNLLKSEIVNKNLSNTIPSVAKPSLIAIEVYPEEGSETYYDFTNYHQAYLTHCEKILSNLDNVRIKGSLSEEVYYHCTSLIRGFLRIFDVLTTLITTGQFEAGQYEKNKVTDSFFFKLPEESNNQKLIKTYIKLSINKFLDEIKTFENSFNEPMAPKITL